MTDASLLSPVTMDGSPVLIGDMVHDVARGEGVVSEIGVQKIICTFGRQRFVYDDLGIGNFGRRTLYWADPVVIAPPRDRTQWLFIQRLMKTTFTQLAEYLPAVLRMGS